MTHLRASSIQNRVSSYLPAYKAPISPASLILPLQLPLATRHLPVTTHHLPLTNYHLPFNQYMQNKPNFQKPNNVLPSFPTKGYEKNAKFRPAKTNPIKPNLPPSHRLANVHQTQTNPICSKPFRYISAERAGMPVLRASWGRRIAENVQKVDSSINLAYL
jgi:hypothetical protein